MTPPFPRPGARALLLATVLLASIPGARALGAQAAGAPPSAPAAQPAPLPSVTLPPALDRVLRDYERAWTGRDPAGLAALFTEDGMTMSNFAPPRRGQSAIREGYANAGGPLALRAVAFAVDDTVGYIIGAYGSRPGTDDTGKFVLALRRAPGGPWRIAADIDNSNRPPRAAGPEAP